MGQEGWSALAMRQAGKEGIHTGGGELRFSSSGGEAPLPSSIATSGLKQPPCLRILCTHRRIDSLSSERGTDQQ